jgi:hypothetical protein
MNDLNSAVQGAPMAPGPFADRDLRQSAARARPAADSGTAVEES